MTACIYSQIYLPSCGSKLCVYGQYLGFEGKKTWTCYTSSIK